ncbi:Zn-ribbon domain-containing OB-fold protein [Nocardioides sp. SYSU DS0651]|uniref:Zn-ribbon domain-containing OB-fold protein n=1 Tax=Nocardioides sp. SYSU DS0651 TaxID=3415955 RepID=UPI003F4BD8D6
MSGAETTTGRVVPVVDDVDTGEFFAAAARGELAIRHCEACGTDLHLPRASCPHCGELGDTWRTVEPRGTLYSWTVVEHQVHPAHPTPYTVVLVELDEAPGVRLVGHVDGRPALTIGQPMAVRFEDVEGVRLPQWVPATEEESDHE